MTKVQALEEFKDIKKRVIEKYGKDDKIALCETWGNFTDNLCRGNRITLKQYESWKNPF